LFSSFRPFSSSALKVLEKFEAFDMSSCCALGSLAFRAASCASFWAFMSSSLVRMANLWKVGLRGMAPVRERGSEQQGDGCQGRPPMPPHLLASFCTRTSFIQ